MAALFRGMHAASKLDIPTCHRADERRRAIESVLPTILPPTFSAAQTYISGAADRRLQSLRAPNARFTNELGSR